MAKWPKKKRLVDERPHLFLNSMYLPFFISTFRIELYYRSLSIGRNGILSYTRGLFPSPPCNLNRIRSLLYCLHSLPSSSKYLSE
jgi:hypothetical protein